MTNQMRNCDTVYLFDRQRAAADIQSVPQRRIRPPSQTFQYCFLNLSIINNEI